MCSSKSLSNCHCGHCVSVCDGKCKGKDDIPTFEKPNHLEICLYGKEELSLEECMFTNNQGIKCKELATWLHQQNRKYCNNHHEQVNKINKEREQLYIKEYKETILNYLRKISHNKYNSQDELYREIFNTIQIGEFDV